MKTVVLATNNAHKVAEIATALDFPGWEFRTLRELGIESDPAEDADTFEGNARIKARAAHEASGGLAALADVPDGERTARFASTLVFVDEDGSEIVAEGTVEGRIGREGRGSEGFGYDPLFLPDVFGGARTLAEVDRDEKNAVSHRGNALRQLRAKLEEAGGANA